MKSEFFRRIFEQSSNTKCHANPFIGRLFVPLWQTDEMKLIETIRNVANVPKIWKYKVVWKAMYKHEYIIQTWFVIHRGTEHCLSVSVCKFFSVPFSSTLFQKRSGSPSWRPRPEYSTDVWAGTLHQQYMFSCLWRFWIYTPSIYILTVVIEVFLFLRDHRMSAAPLVAATTESVAICIMQCYCIPAAVWNFLLRLSCTTITNLTITPHGSCAWVCPGYIIRNCFISKISVHNVCILLCFPKMGPTVPFLRTDVWPKYFSDNFFFIPKFPGLGFTGATTWMCVAQCVDFRDFTLCAYER